MNAARLTHEARARVVVGKSASGSRTWEIEVAEGVEDAELSRLVELALAHDAELRERTARDGIPDYQQHGRGQKSGNRGVAA
jgi:hypothetical protein